MQNIFKENQYWPDNTIYFFTDSTFLHFPYFRNEDQKQIVGKYIKKAIKDFQFDLLDYSIAMNHYHLRFYLKCGSDISKIKKLLRAGISREYRQRFDVPYEEIWQSCKILRITSEKMNNGISGYIAGNLLKHKEISTFEELKQNRFSSFRFLCARLGDDEARKLVKSVIDIGEDSWGWVDLKKMGKIKAYPFD